MAKPNQLLTSADFDLIDSLGLPSRPAKAAMAFQDAFDMIGGVYRLAKWADQNPDKFYSLYSKLVPSTIEVNEKKDITVTIEWATPDRLKYRHKYVDSEVRPTATVHALPQPGAAVVVPMHPPASREDSGPGE